MAEKRGEESRSEMNGSGDETMGGGSSSSSSSSSLSLLSSSSSGVNLVERLNEIIVEGGDGDLLMQQSNRESNFLQWLQALDFQVMGACRADERLKPLLKINAASFDAVEDRLLAHLSQHFEASEVGLLARCLCVPLVSMRVGKLVKQGSQLCPTPLRGTLNLALLPSSDLRLSFIGDNDQTERLATLSNVSESSTVSVEEIPADPSGRSFLVKLCDGETFYFWCSERSKLLGIDLLSKMKDFIRRQPTLSELTGISETRLECFATYLRAYLAGPTASSIQASVADVNQISGEPDRFSSTSVRSLRFRQNGCQGSKANTQCQISLSPRPGSFKEGLPKTLSSLRNMSKEKIRRRGDLHLSPDSLFMSEEVLNISEKGNKSSETSPLSLSFLESLGKSNFPPPPSETLQLPGVSSLLSPYYCWCPPCTSPIVKLPTSFSEPFSLPPLSTLLPSTVSTGLLSPIPPLELPALLSDPLVGLPFTKEASQGSFPTFTPLMCDPIVHIPVLDVCSLGQGYLVSAGPGIATSIPPLHPKLMGPIMSEGESLLEQGARETLRLLIGGSGGQPTGSLIGVFPSVLCNEDKQGVMVSGSRGLYSGISDVDAMVNGFAGIDLSSAPDRSMRICSLPTCTSSGVPDALEQTPCGPDIWHSTFMSREDQKDC